MAISGMRPFVRWLQRSAVPRSSLALLAVCGAVRAQEAQPPPEPDTEATAPKQSDQDASKQSDQDVPYHWLDRTRDTLYDTMWHSAEHVDRWFGSAEDDAIYRQAHGSIAPALLYTQFDGLRTQVRFNMNFPLPQINDRIHAYVGRFDPNEFITERDEPSGSFPRTYGPRDRRPDSSGHRL